MMQSRRKLLSVLLVSGVPLGVLSQLLGGQVRPPNPPARQEPKGEDTGEPKETKFDSKAMLEANRKDIKKSAERLFQLASELKAEVEKTDSVQVLSVAMLKKAEEIEKLAKAIRSRAIG